MAGPLVSVVIPVYNGERYLRAALDSVLGQTHPAVEVVAVNDGSTDGSDAILTEYSERIHVVRQANAGVGQARNAGIRAAAGEFIAFLDQDDWWLPEKLQKQLPLFAADSAVGLVHAPVFYFDNAAGHPVEPLNPHARPELLTGDCLEQLLLCNGIRNSSVVVRRSVLDQVGDCSPEIAGNTVQDYDLWLRIARVSRLAYVPEELSYFRLHPGQGMKNHRQMLTEELRLLRRMLAGTELEHAPSMKRRLAVVLQELGVEHQDARDARQARRAFAEALRACWSWKCAARLALSYVR